MRFHRRFTAGVWCGGLLGALTAVVCLGRAAADEPAVIKAKAEAEAIAKLLNPEAKQKLPEWDKVVKGAKHMESLFPCTTTKRNRSSSWRCRSRSTTRR